MGNKGKVIRVLKEKGSYERIEEKNDKEGFMDKIDGFGRWPFDVSNEEEIKKYLKRNYGKGYFHVFEIGGVDPIVEYHFKGWIKDD